MLSSYCDEGSWSGEKARLMLIFQALQSHPPTLPVVPNKVVVAQRLAQCLDPDLPSGVHQKTLEVYTFIFDMLQVRLFLLGPVWSS